MPCCWRWLAITLIDLQGQRQRQGRPTIVPVRRVRRREQNQRQNLRCRHSWFPPFGRLRSGSFAKDAKDGAPILFFADAKVKDGPAPDCQRLSSVDNAHSLFSSVARADKRLRHRYRFCKIRSCVPDVARFFLFRLTYVLACSVIVCRPSGAGSSLCLLTHGLRRGLHSVAALRLVRGSSTWTRAWKRQDQERR
jgi:hypothetical protein